MSKKYNINLIKNNYDNNGWVFLRNFIDINEVNKIKEIIKNFVEHKINNENKPRDLNFIGNDTSFKNLNSFHDLKDNKEIRDIADSIKVKNIVNFLLNSESEYRQSELFAKPKKNGLPSPDHQDNYYWAVKGSNALTMWIALDKSNKENGAVHYYDGSHKFGILDHEESYAKGSSQKIKDKEFLKKFNKSQPELDAGDAIIHHSLIVHGSAPNNSNFDRQGLTIQFKDKNAEYDKEQKLRYEKSLEKQIKDRIKQL